MSIYIDLTDFLHNPTKTGIQRISGEICKYAPADALTPIRIKDDHYVKLRGELIGSIGRFFSGSDHAGSEELMKLAEPLGRPPMTISSDDIVIIPEIFDQQRASFMERMPEEQFKRCRFIIFDLLPYTHPQYFLYEYPIIIAPYLRTARRAYCCGFISDYTRDTYYGRLRRTATRGGQVLSLGADALGPRNEGASLNRRHSFIVLGTVEPRKNHALILEAFEPLLRQIPGLELSFIGRMGWVESNFAKKVEALNSDPKSGFHFYSTPGDEQIRIQIEQARATIYVSAAEGYGLPPVESLWLGTPVIASALVPSLTRLGSSGIHYVEPLNVVNLRRAVLAFLDDDYANQKIKEATSMNLPTWRSFTEEVFEWCRAECPSADEAG
jgi:glycosyltransferase involved in cell wall biosynthesis